MKYKKDEERVQDVLSHFNAYSDDWTYIQIHYLFPTTLIFDSILIINCKNYLSIFIFYPKGYSIIHIWRIVTYLVGTKMGAQYSNLNLLVCSINFRTVFQLFFRCSVYIFRETTSIF